MSSKSQVVLWMSCTYCIFISVEFRSLSLNQPKDSSTHYYDIYDPLPAHDAISFGESHSMFWAAVHMKSYFTYSIVLWLDTRFHGDLLQWIRLLWVRSNRNQNWEQNTQRIQNRDQVWLCWCCQSPVDLFWSNSDNYYLEKHRSEIVTLIRLLVLNLLIYVCLISCLKMQ